MRVEDFRKHLIDIIEILNLTDMGCGDFLCDIEARVTINYFKDLINEATELLSHAHDNDELAVDLNKSPDEQAAMLHSSMAPLAGILMQLKDKLALRWKFFNNTNVIYFRYQNSQVNLVCTNIAKLLFMQSPTDGSSEKKLHYYDLMMPGLSTILCRYKDSTHKYYDLCEMILRDDGVTPLVVIDTLHLIACESSRLSLSQSEKDRLINHSQEANSYYSALKSGDQRIIVNAKKQFHAAVSNQTLRVQGGYNEASSHVLAANILQYANAKTIIEMTNFILNEQFIPKKYRQNFLSYALNDEESRLEAVVQIIKRLPIEEWSGYVNFAVSGEDYTNKLRDFMLRYVPECHWQRFISLMTGDVSVRSHLIVAAMSKKTPQEWRDYAKIVLDNVDDDKKIIAFISHYLDKNDWKSFLQHVVQGKKIRRDVIGNMLKYISHDCWKEYIDLAVDVADHDDLGSFMLAHVDLRDRNDFLNALYGDNHRSALRLLASILNSFVKSSLDQVPWIWLTIEYLHNLQDLTWMMEDLLKERVWKELLDSIPPANLFKLAFNVEQGKGDLKSHQARLLLRQSLSDMIDRKEDNEPVYSRAQWYCFTKIYYHIRHLEPDVGFFSFASEKKFKLAGASVLQSFILQNRDSSHFESFVADYCMSNHLNHESLCSALNDKSLLYKLKQKIFAALDILYATQQVNRASLSCLSLNQ